METRRQRALRLLQERSEGWSARDLAQALELDEATVRDDLRHLQRSLRGSGLEMLVLPARCRSCGWEARADAPRSPRRCAKCRSEWLDDARFRVGPA